MKKHLSILLLSCLFAVSAVQAGNEEHRKQFEETGYCKRCDLSGFDLRPSIERFNKLNDEGKAISNLKKLHNNVWNLWSANIISLDEAQSGKLRINLEESVLSGSNLSGCNLENANLYNTKANGTNFEKANLKGACLNNIEAEGANFERANLKRAHLVRAFLKKANFKKADLRKAQLPWVNAAASNFEEANLKGTRLYDAKFWGARFKKAKFDGAELKGAEFPIITGLFARIRAWWHSK